MFLLWLVILIIYGLVEGFSNIRALEWLLLVVFFFQEWTDAQRKFGRPW